jgi:two-component system LytT family response regulator
MTYGHHELRVLVVDDEPPARELVVTLLRAEPDVVLAGECANGSEAVEAILRLAPDVVFLDVQMPGLDGFEVLEAVSKAMDLNSGLELGGRKLPLVIFVTAFDRHAVRAFEAHAADYLLKPFDFDRLREAMQRVRMRLRQPQPRSYDQSVLALLENLRTRDQTWDRLAIRDAGRTFFVKPEEIDWLEAEGNYVRLHLGKKSYLLRQTMSALEQRLAARKFLRINRSTLVNLEQVTEWQGLFHGDSVLILKDGTRLTLSRNYRERFQQFAGAAA